MANSTDVAASAAVALGEPDLERVREFTREPILLEGETLDDLLPGSARHHAAVDALGELEDGAEVPSFEWRSRYSLLLGLERLLSEAEPHLLDGATLNEHQVDALSGTLAAITAEIEKDEDAAPGTNGALKRNGNGNGNGHETKAAEPPETDNGVPEAGLEDEVLAEEEEPQDWEEPEADEVIPEAPEDPGASSRFWFEHALCPAEACWQGRHVMENSLSAA
jgi:hypothetical protein